MATAQAVWGIDVGRCALKAVKLRPGADGKIEVVALDYVEHAKILSQPDADRHALIGAALEKFLSRNDVSKDQVFVSVPGQHTLARFTKLPPVAPKRIPDIVRYEADQQIPFDMDEVIWDYQTFQQEGMPDLEVGIFAMKRELIREHLLHFEQASIEPIGVQSGPLAVYNAAHYDGWLDEHTTILLDIGAENTDLIVATKDAFWTRTVPIGGNRFTEALVKAFKLSFSKAENLKRTAEDSKYARQIFQAMRPVFADLVQELQRSIGFYSSTHRDANVERVLGVGNAFQLPGLQKYLQQNLSMTVDRPQAFKNATATAVAGQDAFKEQFLSFFVAYGLAIQGLELSKVTSNLLPTEIAKQVVWRKKRPTFAAAAACLVAAGALIWFRLTSDMSALAAGAKDEKPPTLTYEQAVSVIASGPRADLTGRGQALAVLGAASTMKRALDDLGGKGKDELKEVDQLVSLHLQKTVVPEMVRVIHEAVPRAQGLLGEAQTPQEVTKAVSGGPSRGEREQVWIESVDLIYEPELGKYVWNSGKVDMPAPINKYDPDTPLAGFYIKITCRSPNAGGSTFIRDKFMMPLRDKGRTASKRFYIDNVILFDVNKVTAASTGAGKTGPSRGSVRGGTASAAATAGIISSVPASSIDPITLEPTTNDWRFDIWASGIVGEMPGEGEAESAEAKDEKKPEDKKPITGKPRP